MIPQKMVCVAGFQPVQTNTIHRITKHHLWHEIISFLCWLVLHTIFHICLSVGKDGQQLIPHSKPCAESADEIQEIKDSNYSQYKRVSPSCITIEQKGFFSLSQMYISKKKKIQKSLMYMSFCMTRTLSLVHIYLRINAIFCVLLAYVANVACLIYLYINLN